MIKLFLPAALTHRYSPTLGGLQGNGAVGAQSGNGCSRPFPCCTPRMGRADIDVANRGVDGSSRPRRLCYPRGNFSVMPGPHRGGHERSLGRGFPAGPPAFRGPVRPAFALALYGGALTRLSRPLGARVTFSRACRPSQTAHLTLSPRDFPGGKAPGRWWVVFHWRLHPTRR